MTVRELISALESLEPDLQVRIGEKTPVEYVAKHYAVNKFGGVSNSPHMQYVSLAGNEPGRGSDF